ncbi:MAG: DUF1289 domain-containing protein [Methylococcales bacterium]|nr:DUF1289 domain-containing protein [Methylococcales bacterium]
MKFKPCITGKCTDQGTHCEGCGRSHEDIAETKKLVKALVDFAQRKGYENNEDFALFIGKSLLNKLQPPA